MSSKRKFNHPVGDSSHLKAEELSVLDDRLEKSQVKESLNANLAAVFSQIKNGDLSGALDNLGRLTSYLNQDLNIDQLNEITSAHCWLVKIHARHGRVEQASEVLDKLLQLPVVESSSEQVLRAINIVMLGHLKNEDPAAALQIANKTITLDVKAWKGVSGLTSILFDKNISYINIKQMHAADKLSRNIATGPTEEALALCLKTFVHLNSYFKNIFYAVDNVLAVTNRLMQSFIHSKRFIDVLTLGRAVEESGLLSKPGIEEKTLGKFKGNVDYASRMLIKAAESDLHLHKEYSSQEILRSSKSSADSSMRAHNLNQSTSSSSFKNASAATKIATFTTKRTAS